MFKIFCFIFIGLFYSGITNGQSCSVMRQQIGASTAIRFTCPANIPDDPALSNDFLINGSQFGLVLFQNNAYSAIPVDILCRFSNAYHINLSYNRIKSIKTTLRRLVCLRGLNEIDLSHNQIQSSLVNEDFSDELSANLEYLDLSFNSIDYLDTNAFLKSQSELRFPKLRYFNINNNQLKIFDLLIPLTLPSFRLQFDASYNPIEKFVNKYRRSFKENPFFYDVSYPNRSVNLVNNKLNRFGDELLDEYMIKTETDLEVFLNRIGNYMLVQRQNSIICTCPTFSSVSVSWFRQLTQIDRSLSLYKLSCSNIPHRPFVLSYSCGVIQIQPLMFSYFNN